MNRLTIDPTDENLQYLAAHKESYTVMLRHESLTKPLHARSIRYMPNGLVGLYVTSEDMPSWQPGEYRFNRDKIVSLQISFA